MIVNIWTGVVHATLTTSPKVKAAMKIFAGDLRETANYN